MPIVDYWTLYDNSNCPAVKLAYGSKGKKITVLEPDRFEALRAQYQTEPEEGDNV